MFKNVLKTWFDSIWWLGFFIAIGSVFLLVINPTFKTNIINNKNVRH